jgi:hypothetical protein
MKGYIYLNYGDGRYLYITIHTKILNPFSFNVVNQDNAVYTSPKFEIKKITDIETKENLHQIYRFRVGDVCVGNHYQQIFKNLKTLRGYHHSLCPPSNGNITYYSSNGFKQSITKRKHDKVIKDTRFTPSETIIKNYKKQTTTIIFKNSPPLIYAYMVSFYRNEFDNNLDLNKILQLSLHHRDQLQKEKTYTCDRTLTNCYTYKNGKKHLLCFFFVYNYKQHYIYINGKHVTKNLQSLLHSPFNFIIKTQIKIF